MLFPEDVRGFQTADRWYIDEVITLQCLIASVVLESTFDTADLHELRDEIACTIGI